jgi:hypothetical protein
VKNPHAVALGRLGGLRGGREGGHARAAALSPERRREIARDAARTRWGALPPSLASLFPGYVVAEIVLPQHLDMVMQHVLARGGPEHRRWLVRRFGDGAIRRWIIRRKGRGFSTDQLSPWISQRTIRSWQAADAYADLWARR